MVRALNPADDADAVREADRQARSSWEDEGGSTPEAKSVGSRSPEDAVEPDPPPEDVRSYSDSVADDSYGADRRTRLRRGRVVGFALSIPLWMLSVIPLAREFTDGRDAASIVLIFLAAGGFTIAVAAAIRGVYVMTMKRRFWSPWLFVLAACVAIVAYTIQSAGEEAIPFESTPAGRLRNATD